MKRVLFYMMAVTTISVLSFGCKEKTEIRTETEKVPQTIIVPQNEPQKEINVNVKTENKAPDPIVEKNTTTNTTIDKNSGTSTTTIHTETKK